MKVYGLLGILGAIAMVYVTAMQKEIEQEALVMVQCLAVEIQQKLGAVQVQMFTTVQKTDKKGISSNVNHV